MKAVLAIAVAKKQVFALVKTAIVNVSAAKKRKNNQKARENGLFKMLLNK